MPLLVPTPSQSFQPVVLDARVWQGGSVVVSVEVGVLPGTREAPNVYQRRDAVLGEQGQEAIQRVVRRASGSSMAMAEPSGKRGSAAADRNLTSAAVASQLRIETLL